jgi:signal transduction histidine kinase
VPCDTVALVVIDERRGVLQTVSVAGALLDVDREVLRLEVPTSALDVLLDALRQTPVVRLSDGPLLELGALMRDQFGVHATMYAAIAQGDRLLGYLGFNHRCATAFSDHDVELARSLAAQCGIALANGALVDELERAGRVKTEFVATMSHELRTPLSVILGYVDVLEDAVPTPEARVALARIRTAGRDLHELIETTLDLGRLESGNDPAHIEPVEMGELWDELATQYDAVPKPGAVLLRWEVQGAPLARTDRRKVKIIVKNLVGNALKFTTAGEIQACVRPAGTRCLVTVRDTGVGIPDEHLGGIFEMFRQVDPADRRAYGGVGLGLYIVQKLAQQIDATLEVRSQVGVGTTFTLALPLEASTRTIAAA